MSKEEYVPIEFSELSTSTTRSLIQTNIIFYKDLEALKGSDLLKIKGFGPKSLYEIEKLLQRKERPTLLEDAPHVRVKHFDDVTTEKRRIAYCLKEKGMKQKDIADVLEVSAGYVHKLIYQDLRRREDS